jgi:hypothetical protein
MVSSDDGITWSKKAVSFVLPYTTYYMDVFKFDGENLVLIYEGPNQNEYFIVYSSDMGETWSVPNKIVREYASTFNRFLRGGDKLLLVYNRTTQNTYPDNKSDKIFYKESYDFGASWSEEKLFTPNAAKHMLAGISASGAKPLIYTYSQRKDYPNYSYFVGDLFQTDVTKDPVVYTLEAIGDSTFIYFDSLFTLRSYIEYGNEASSITVEYNSQTYELRDDGLHNDRSANDNFYGVELQGISDEVGGIYEAAMRINNITIPFNTRGVLASVADAYPVNENVTLYAQREDGKIKSKSTTIYFYPLSDKGFRAGGVYDDYVFLYSAGFWLSGFVNNNMWANGVSTVDFFEDYLPGRVGSNPDDPRNRIYKVSSSSIPFGEEWLQWKDAVKLGAEFYDGDNNFKYTPIDHNENGVWDVNEDRPNLIYDEMYFTVYNDSRPKEDRILDQMPLGIEVRQNIFGSSNNTLLKNTFFVKYTIINRGTVADTLKDVIFSFVQDPDLGIQSDDLPGVDTSLSSSFVYNLNEDPLYGPDCPSAFFTILQGPQKYTGSPDDIAVNKRGPLLGAENLQGYVNAEINSFMFYQSSDPDLGNPYSIEMLRNYVKGRDKKGNIIDPCSFTLGNVLGINCSEVNPFYWFSGDPVTQTGWLGTHPTDIRNALSTEPFDLVKNKPVNIIVAYTIGKGSDNINSITKARETVNYLFEEYERNFSTIVGVDDKSEKVVNNFSLSQNYPNPFNPTTKIEYSVETQHAVSLQVFNILGQKVKTLVNEVKSPGTYEVIFDASQLASGVYFYRLTAGSFVQTKKLMVIK